MLLRLLESQDTFPGGDPEKTGPEFQTPKGLFTEARKARLARAPGDLHLRFGSVS